MILLWLCALAAHPSAYSAHTEEKVEVTAKIQQWYADWWKGITLYMCEYRWALSFIQQGI